MFTGNVRLPDQIAGDLSAMCNVFNVGRRGLDTLLARYGREKLADCIARDDGSLGSADALLHRRDPGRRYTLRGLLRQ